MREKNLKSENSVELWIQAYEEHVRDVLNYQGYAIKSSAGKHFERLKNLYPDVNPFTFMAAMFDPINWWGVRDKKGNWKKLKYPFPTMLVGRKAENIYHKYVKNRKKEMGDKQAEILESVQISLDKLKLLKVNLNDKEEIYHLATDGTISMYLLVCLKDMYLWYIYECNKGVLDNTWFKEINDINRYLSKHYELKDKIVELLEVYDRI